MNRYHRARLPLARLIRIAYGDVHLRRYIRRADIRDWLLGCYISVGKAAHLRLRRRDIANDIGPEVFG